MPTLWQGVKVAGIYVALIAFGTFVVSNWVRPGADIALLWTGLFAVQAVGAGYVVGAVRRGLQWRAIGFDRIDWRALVWLTPAVILLITMGRSVVLQTPLAVFTAVPAAVWALVVATPFLIAFAEEVVFRGILLRGAMVGATVLRAIMISTSAFALAHLINGLAGQEAVNTLLQTAFAFLVGLSLAPLALRIGNLWPLIIWHWLWNIVVLVSQIIGVLHPFAVVGMAMQAVVSMWLWTRVRDHQRQASA